MIRRSSLEDYMKIQVSAESSRLDPSSHTSDVESPARRVIARFEILFCTNLVKSSELQGVLLAIGPVQVPPVLLPHPGRTKARKRHEG